MLEMNIGGRDESMNARLLGALDRFQSAVDIALLGARQADDARPANLLADPAHRFEIAVRRGGKAGFDHVDAEFLQLARDHDFLLHGHARARRLLAVAQRGIENLYDIILCSSHVHFSVSSIVIRWPDPEMKTPAAGPTGV